jgi:hypothetical protein
MSTSHPFPPESVCPSPSAPAHLHGFETSPRSTPGTRVEVCTYCGEREAFNVVPPGSGTIDTARYARSHFKDFLQRTHPLFDKAYPPE